MKTNVLYLCVGWTMCQLVLAGDSDSKNTENLWEQDLGDSFNIGASTDNLQKVNLRCGADSMQVYLETVEDFTGVMYTRGSFYKQTAPCFAKPKPGKSVRALKMKFSLDDCLTKQDGEVFSNVVVVQHDPDLVTPGDAAFSLECDFSSPRNLTVEADIQARDSAHRLASSSKITLVSPDPVVQKNAKVYDSVQNHSETVTFTPNTILAQPIRGTVETIVLDGRRVVVDEFEKSSNSEFVIRT